MLETMKPLLAELSELAAGYIPNLLGALAILVLGWLAARILAAVVRGALQRTTLDNRLARWMQGDDGGELQVERLISRTVFYLAMLFVLVGVFQALELSVVTEPLNALLTEIGEFAPRLLAAGALLLLAWVVATVARTMIGGMLKTMELDSRLGDQAGLGDESSLPVAETLAEAIYWFVWVLFLPAVLGALALDGLLAPVQGLAQTVLGFMPNVLAGTAIFAIGWFAARLVQRVVSSLAAATGLDEISKRAGLEGALGGKPLSGLVGMVCYVLILVPVLIAGLNALQLDAITAPASDMLGRVLVAIPALFAAILVLAIAYLAGKLVANLVTHLLRGAGFDNMLQKLGLDVATEGERSPANVLGQLTLVAILLFASIEAAGLLGFESVAGLLSAFVVFAGEVTLGLFVLGVGMFLANVAANAIRAVDSAQSAFLATAARVAILVVASAMALQQMGFADEIISLAFGLLMGSIAIAAGLAFGLGCRELAGRHAEEWVQLLRESRSDETSAGSQDG